jgi:2'-5' RNA ligase
MVDYSAGLYFLAIIPPTPVYERVHELKLIFAREYHSSHALNSPPHITVIPPFKIPHVSLTILAKFFHENMVFFQPYIVMLDGFGCFQPRVIYIKPQISPLFTEARNQLLSRFYELFPQSRQDTRPFLPHMTVAFKDLIPTMFSKAWPVVSRMDFSAFFRIDELVLLKYESGKWVVFQRFPLTENNSIPC